MLQKIAASNFKSWRELPEIRFGELTAFFGTNSSGKSSILQLLLLLKQTVQSTDRSQPLNLGDERSLVSLGTFGEMIHGHARESMFRFSGSWRLPRTLKIKDPDVQGAELFSGNELSFATAIRETKSGRLVVDRLQYRFAGRAFTMSRPDPGKNQYKLKSSGNPEFRFLRTRGRPWELPAPIRFYGFPDQVKAYHQNAGFLGDLELALEERFNEIHYLGPLREYPRREYTWAGTQPADMGQRGEKAVDAILAARQRGDKISRGKGKRRLGLEEYVALWLRTLGLIHSFEVEELAADSNLYRVWVRTRAGSARVLITDVGFGVSQILPVITLCFYAPEGSTVVLEQPEIHLHPAVQSGLADVLLEAIKVRRIQIILESHSEHLLRRLQRRIAEEQVTPDGVRLYFSQVKRKESSLQPLELDMFGSISNWPDGFFGDDFAEVAAMAEAVARRRVT